MGGGVCGSKRSTLVPPCVGRSDLPPVFRRKLRRGSIPQAAVRPYRVVIHPPGFDDPPRLLQAHEPVLVQAFVPELPVKTFDERVLHRFPRLDEVQRHAMRIRPLVHRLADELRPVVHLNRFRIAPLLRHFFQPPHHARSGQRTVHFDPRRFPREPVHQIQRAKWPPARQTVPGEVHRPELILPCGQHQRHPRCGPKSFAFLAPHRQSFLPVDPIHPLVVHHPLRSAVLLLPPQHFMHPPVPEARTLARNFPQSRSQCRIVPFPPSIAATPSVHSQQPTGAPLAQPGFFAHDSYRFSLRRWAYHFFDSTTFSASMSSACCATIFFSRPFSSSSCRSRRASFTSNPPYLVFQW